MQGPRSLQSVAVTHILSVLPACRRACFGSLRGLPRRLRQHFRRMQGLPGGHVDCHDDSGSSTASRLQYVCTAGLHGTERPATQELASSTTACMHACMHACVSMMSHACSLLCGSGTSMCVLECPSSACAHHCSRHMTTGSRAAAISCLHVRPATWSAYRTLPPPVPRRYSTTAAAASTSGGQPPRWLTSRRCPCHVRVAHWPAAGRRDPAPPAAC